MKLYQLFEGRDAPLYHSTGIGSAISIIKTDEIRAATEHFTHKLHIGKTMDETSIKGVSLSRDIRFCLKYSLSMMNVIFEINQTKLSQTNKLVPISYFDSGWQSSYKKDKTRRSINSFDYESEEFCINSIKPLSKYLISIIVSRNLMDFYNNMKDSEYKEQMKIIIKQPSLRVINIPML